MSIASQNGIPVANAVANVALNQEEDVVAFGANFHSNEVARGGLVLVSSF